MGGEDVECLNNAVRGSGERFGDRNVERWRAQMPLEFCEEAKKRMCLLHGINTDEIRKRDGHTHKHCSLTEILAVHLSHNDEMKQEDVNPNW